MIKYQPIPRPYIRVVLKMIKGYYNKTVRILVQDIKPPIYFHQTTNILLKKLFLMIFFNDALKCILGHLHYKKLAKNKKQINNS